MEVRAGEGKVALVTGASSGIGLATAEGLARAGFRVLMAARDPARGARAAGAVRATAPGAPAPEVVRLDLGVPASVRALAAALGGGRLDLLVANAGVAAAGRGPGAWGAEPVLGVNHLGHFALTGLLMPALRRAAAPRVVTVTSVVHRRGRLDPARLAGPRRGRAWTAYRASKLANLVFAIELARRCAAAGSDLVSVAAHPGLAATALGRAGAGPTGLGLGVLLRLRGQAADAGARPVLLAATDPGVLPGGLYGPGGPGALAGDPALEIPAPRALDAGLAGRLWEASERMTGVVFDV
jgi:NAD(P)-dependent dehydrogenase (short-subunit alcohol dehydrogenase family)